MSSSNRISAVITPEQLQACNDAITALKASIKDVLTINLTADDRRTVLKMGDKTLAFVEKSLEYAAQNPNLAPVFMDLPEAKKDYELAKTLYSIYQQVNTLLTAIEDTEMVAGGEAYEAALVFYHAVKGASRSNVAGSQAIYDDLSQRFPGHRKANTIPPQL